MSLRLGRPDHFSDVGSDYSSVSSSSGEVRYRRALRCGPHPALLGLEDRAEVMLNSVFR